jgi:hypothetical protein
MGLGNRESAVVSLPCIHSHINLRKPHAAQIESQKGRSEGKAEVGGKQDQGISQHFMLLSQEVGGRGGGGGGGGERRVTALILFGAGKQLESGAVDAHFLQRLIRCNRLAASSSGGGRYVCCCRGLGLLGRLCV